MKRLLLLLLFLPTTVIASVQDQFVDAVGGDKMAHAIAGATITYATYSFTDASIKTSFAVGCGAGLLKEIVDSGNGGSGFDELDLVATCLGAFGGGFTIHHLENKGVVVKRRWSF